MCYGQQAQAEKEEVFQDLWKEEQGAKCFDWKEIQKVCKKKEMRKTEKELQNFQEMKIFDDDSKICLSLAKSLQSGEILYSSSEWKIVINESFVSCLNRDSESKINYLDLLLILV